MNAIFFFRVANWLHRRRIPLLPSAVKGAVFLVFNSVIPFECRIGRGTWFAHGGIGVVLHPECVIGEHVQIGQCVTIGGTFGSGVPVIGDNVWIGPGARILGNIKVGSNVVIGANAVVVRDVDDNSIVGGIPARLIRRIGPRTLDVENGLIRDA